MRIYVSSLTDYNAGILHGAWIEIDSDTTLEEIQSQIQEILDTSPVARKGHGPAEEWRIDDHEDWDGIDPGRWRLESLPILAGMLGDHPGAVVSLALDHTSGDDVTHVESAREWINDNHQGTFSDLATWAEDFLADTGALSEVPDSLRSYIDFGAWARDAEMSGDIVTVETSDGIAVFCNR